MSRVIRFITEHFTALKNLGIAALVLVLLLIILGRWRSGYEFRELALNGEQDVLEQLAKRPSVQVNTTSQAGIIGVVGLVLVIDGDKKQAGERFSTMSVIPSYRPKSDLIRVDPVNKTLYEGKVSKAVSGKSSYVSFAGTLADEQAADIIIKDEVTFLYKNPNDIPYPELRKIKREPGKHYFFVHTATITSTTYRTYSQLSSDGAIDGTAFKANGRVYISNQNFAHAVTVSIDAFDIGQFQTAEGGGEEDKRILQLYRRHIAKNLDDKGARELLRLVTDGSRETAQLLSGATLDPK